MTAFVQNLKNKGVLIAGAILIIGIIAYVSNSNSKNKLSSRLTVNTTVQKNQTTSENKSLPTSVVYEPKIEALPFIISESESKDPGWTETKFSFAARNKTNRTLNFGLNYGLAVKTDDGNSYRTLSCPSSTLSVNKSMWIPPGSTAKSFSYIDSKWEEGTNEQTPVISTSYIEPYCVKLPKNASNPRLTFVLVETADGVGVANPDNVKRSDSVVVSEPIQVKWEDLKKDINTSFDDSQFPPKTLPVHWSIDKMPEVTIEKYELIQPRDLIINGCCLNRYKDKAQQLGAVLRITTKVKNNTVSDLSMTGSERPISIMVWGTNGVQYTDVTTAEVQTEGMEQNKMIIGPTQENSFIADFFIPSDSGRVFAILYPRPFIFWQKPSDQEALNVLSQRIGQYIQISPVAVEIIR